MSDDLDQRPAFSDAVQACLEDGWDKNEDKSFDDWTGRLVHGRARLEKEFEEYYGKTLDLVVEAAIEAIALLSSILIYMSNPHRPAITAQLSTQYKAVFALRESFSEMNNSLSQVQTMDLWLIHGASISKKVETVRKGVDDNQQVFVVRWEVLATHGHAAGEELGGIK